MIKRTEIDNIPLSIAAMHPAKEVIENALVRRGDKGYVANGRALAIVDLLIRQRLIKRTPQQIKLQREFRKSTQGKTRKVKYDL